MTKEDQNAGSVPNVVSDDTQGKDQVAYETHQKVLSQRKADQKKAAEALAEAAELRAQLSAIETAKKDAELDKQKQSGNWQALLDAKAEENARLEQEREDAKAEASQYAETLSNAVKLNSVLNALPGKLKNSAYSQFIDLSKVAVNPDTNEIDGDSVGSVVEAFISQHADLIDTKNFKGLPGDSANGNFTDPIKKFKGTELKDMRKAVPDAVRAAKQQMNLN